MHVRLASPCGRSDNRPMLHVVLHQPQIPPNTGNVIRLCANSGARLHLIRPMGFDLDDARLRRAGLDYREYVDLRVHEDFAAFLSAVTPARVFALSTRGTLRPHDVSFGRDDAVMFGSETRGLPQALLDTLPPDRCLRLPMRPDNRSLNLSNAVAVVVYEAWRQMGFEGSL
ncbi:tRNA (uridine(34)/cytosine(34)/5-carboxymethylaminomethyluridine(34)-2'-O)-methyltransferase TrmL [Tahibacter sp.]|uniref:tRNA (uridine(34)/cytosine(34)/5- carboxymethylaminomethyluridine(34)-2'-O)- methyltransferase TrmL n=1 Tax=Tahibacter sp. TaxID=2056211 RepID=UPI0028C3CB70|nr:tRNA (uridine(34)/cytosine(34)/5-carboxymethylaminomethyluridine(34)-2'-O)-methyltransferase TrmL [Tahibacter sp.]